MVHAMDELGGVAARRENGRRVRCNLHCKLNACLNSSLSLKTTGRETVILLQLQLDTSA